MNESQELRGDVLLLKVVARVATAIVVLLVLCFLLATLTLLSFTTQKTLWTCIVHFFITFVCCILCIYLDFLSFSSFSRLDSRREGNRMKRMMSERWEMERERKEKVDYDESSSLYSCLCNYSFHLLFHCIPSI